MIGFPLRLLAREVYDKVIKKISLDKVALITGEEKIIPNSADYFICGHLANIPGGRDDECFADRCSMV